jgi:DNA helicase HerA-like ATPase
VTYVRIYEATPTVVWDLFGEKGHPIRATVSDLGPLLLGRVLDLNETQEGVLSLVFKVADDNGLLLLDLKDLRAMLQHVGDHAQEFQTNYGNVSAASIGAIQRGLLALEQQGPEIHQRADAERRRLPDRTAGRGV